MAIFNNILAGAAGSAGGAAAGYEITRSLRFNSADSAYLNRTPSSASNRRTFTFSTWVKRHKLGTDQKIFGVNSNWFTFYFTGDNLRVYYENSGSQYFTTDAVFRDVSAWYHLVLKVDTTQSSASDRVKIYANGEELSFSSTGTTSQNYEFGVNTTNVHDIGMRSSESNMKADFSLAEVNFIDGQALAPTDFGGTDSDNNWNPKEYSGSYGTNGFHLDFSDNTSTTTIAEDSSGNNNDWTANNLSVASGAGNDSLIDTPTNYEASSGNNGGNYATLNPLQKSSGSTLSNGNLDISMSSAQGITFATMAFPASGKWYFECTSNATECDIGIAKADASLSQYLGKNSSGYGYYKNGTVYNNDVSAGSGASYASGDIIGVAFDADAGTCKWYKNNALQVTVSSLSGEWFPAFGAGSAAGIFNFGSRPFAYTPPSNHLPLVTTNLPDPTIADGSTAMDVVTYTGNGSTQTISGLSMGPDLVWLKARSDAYDHHLIDSVRGVTKALFSNRTNAETTYSTGLTAFNSDGFTLGGELGHNGSSKTYVGWAWDAGTSTATNTDGSITANVRANPSAGFSIVSYTGDGSGTDTIGHGLNDAPSLVITKSRGTTGSWRVFTDVGGTWKLGNLNNTDAFVNATVSAPTSSVFSIDGNSNASTTHIAYCFAAVAGYSAFGSYTGNGSSDGPFVYTGFRPKFCIVKISSTTGNWLMYDTSRDIDNVVSAKLYPNSNIAEDSSVGIYDFLSNGFKARHTGATNTSGATYVWAAFAEHPFKTARAR